MIFFFHFPLTLHVRTSHNHCDSLPLTYSFCFACEGAVSIDFLTSTYDATQDIAVVSNAHSADSALREFSGEMVSFLFYFIFRYL